MKSQTKLTLPTIASISTIIVTALISTAIISQSTSALTYQDSTDVKFTFNPTININLSSTDLVIPELTSGSSSDSNEVTVSVSTNTGYGYYLSATAGTKTGNTSLNNTLDSSYKFTNLTANAPSLSAMPDNSWGYSYSTDNGTTWVSGDAGSTMTGYNGLPLDNDDSGATGIKLVSTDSFTSSSSIKFKIGAKSAPTQAAGTYTNTVNFYAVANPAPPKTIADASSLQEVEACPSTLPTGQVYTVKDSRDNQDYKVARLADGKCWMVENLNLAGGTALSADDTDVTSSYIDSFTTSNNLTKEGNTIVLPESPSLGYDRDYAYIYNTNNKSDDCSDSGCYSYYSWGAATLGSGSDITVDNTNAEQSICPKNWHLPSTSGKDIDSDSDFRALMIGYGGSDSIQLYNNSTIPTGTTMYNNIGSGSAPNYLLSGYYYAGSWRGVGNYGLYWSSTSYNSNYYARRLQVTATMVNAADNDYKYYTYSVRCLFNGSF